MKSALLLLALFGFGSPNVPTRAPVEIRELSAEGRIEGENLTFDLTFTARVNVAGSVLRLVTGNAALMDAPPEIFEDLQITPAGLMLRCPDRGERRVSLRVVVKQTRDGDAWVSQLVLPEANLRRVTVRSEPVDLDVRLDQALDVRRERLASGGTLVSAALAPGRPLALRWQPRVTRLAGDLVVECDANLIVAARAGALRLDSLYAFRIVQGQLNRLTFDVPEGDTITQVRGADVREWTVGPRDGGGRVLAVTLSRPQEKAYQLHVEHERPLPPLPCELALSPLAPREVFRASGFVLVGADGALRLVVKKAAGLTQIDRSAFTVAPLNSGSRLAPPTRSSFAYQCANFPYQLSLSAEDVVTSLQAEQRLTLSLADNDLALDAVLDVEVRDAPARELTVETEAGWNVTAVTGENVADYDVQDQGPARRVQVHFRNEALGRQLVTLRLERTLPASAAAFDAPVLRVAGARAERGFVALRGELGVTLRAASESGLREVPTASLPIKIADAQYAARFKAPGWKLGVAVVREQPSISAEVFDLATFGESAVYGSSLVTYLINGAPVRTLRLGVPAEWRNLEVTGRDVRSWRMENGVCLVSLQEKVVGDYTLLVTYDRQVPYAGGDVQAGGLRALDAANESGYLALAAPPGVALAAETNQPAGLLTIDGSELPAEYAAMIKDPVLRAYKYAGGPHLAAVSFRRYTAGDLLDHAADLVLLNTRLSEEGEVVTELTCQVKNASRQYLGLALPEGARLWSVSVDGEKAQALERGQGRILVALPRRLDPNQPTRVDVVTASQGAKVGWWQTIALRAPALDARSIYARWKVSPPAHCRITGGTGDLAAPAGSARGLPALGEHLGRLVRHFTRGGAGWLGLFVIALGLAMLFAFNAGRGAGFPWTSWLGITAALLFGWIVLDALPLRLPAAPDSAPAEQAWTFSKTITLSEGGLGLDLTVERGWVCAVRTGIWLAGALALVGFALARLRARPLAFGLCVVAGLALAAQRNPWLGPTAVVVLAALAALLAIGLVRRAHRLGTRHRVVVPVAPAPLPEAPVDGLPQQSGLIDLRLLLAVGLLGLAASAWAKGAAATPMPAAPVQAALACTPLPPPPTLVMDRVSAAVVLPGPATNGEAPGDLTVTLDLSFRAEKPGEFLLLPGRCVVTSSSAAGRQLEVIARDGGYWLRVGRAQDGRVTVNYRVPAADDRGTLTAPLLLPPHIINEVSVRLPSADWVVETPAAAYLTSGTGREAGTARLVLSGTEAPLTWRPRSRVARLEKASFFAELQTVVRAQPGLVNLTHHIRYQIAQGELQTLRFEVPVGASVTAVSGVGLGTWRFDPATRGLEAVLARPVSGEYALRVVTQVAREGLPYEAKVRELVVLDAARQRGVLALVADEGVQLNAGEPEGAAAMYPGDFPPEALALEVAGRAGSDVKRAYRYQQANVVLPLAALRVEPELRAVEEARVDITDERVVLTSRLQLDIAKAGVFTVWLELPEGFDVDALTGDDVSHWDEVREEGHAVAVHFGRQVQGARTLNLVVSRQERGRLDELTLPRVALRGALKHGGTLAVSAERGLRLSTVQREGASEVNPRDMGIQQPGYLAFRLLRPDWALRVKIEAAQPVIKAEVVQRVVVTEGLLQARCRVVYSIEHAGVKTFHLLAPQPDAALVVSGPGLARVQLVDAAKGRWEIEMQAKREGVVALDVAYQMPYDVASGRLVLRSLQCEGVDGQRGYLAVLAGGRLEVKAGVAADGLESEDPRTVPARLGAGDLSDAALCFRATRGDVALPLEVTRHEAAGLLAARVQSVDITSVLAEDGSLATLTVLKLEHSTLRFLNATLPAGADVWSVFVNGRAVRPLTEGGRLLIPMSAASGGAAEVELTYGARLASGWLGRRKVPGPTFDLPLQHVAWRVYVPAGARYRGFGGTLNHQADAPTEAAVFSPESYEQVNRVLISAKTQKAAQVLQQGNEYWKQGRQAEARQALEEAVAYSQGDRGLNEDARIQFQSLARQQAVVGLAARRSAMKIRNNTAQQQDLEQTQQYNGGNFSSDFSKQVQQTLGAKENDSLVAVADKLLEQQVAAGGAVHPVQVTLPLEGQCLTFTRELQVQPDAPIQVEFTASRGGWAGHFSSAGLGLVLVGLFAGAAGLGLRRA